MSDDAQRPVPQGQVLIYADGATELQVRLEGQTVWLTQAGMAELFQTTPQNITFHLQSIYADNELDESATCKEYLQVRREGARDVHRTLKHYSLDAILAVGYCVRSARGTAFRQWATARLSELLVKGFTMDDEKDAEASQTQRGRAMMLTLAGLCLLGCFANRATNDPIARHGHALAPGRYVGAEEQAEDDEPFAEKYPRLVAELEQQLAEGERLAASIRRALGGISNAG